MNLTVFALVWIGLLLAIPIWIGIYVYRDARDREMNAPLWTLAAVLLPAFVGLILYLLCRSDHPNLHCPQCGGPVRESFAICPRCGAALKNRCVRCGLPLEAGWTVCPGCGEPIREDAAAYTPPVARRDRGLKWLIAAAIALPLLLVLLALLSFTTFSHSGSTSTGGISSVSLEEVDPDSALGAWTGGLQGQEGIFVLSSTEETGDGQASASYWIYLGGVEALQSFTQFQEGGLFGGDKRMEVALVSDSHCPPAYLILAQYTGDDPLGPLLITLDGESQPYALTEAEGPLSPETQLLTY